MKWLVADSLYCPEALPFSHLDSYTHYLNEAGESASHWQLSRDAAWPRGWPSFVDVVFALDQYDRVATAVSPPDAGVKWAADHKRIAQVAAICNPMPWDVRKPDGSPAYDLVISSIPWMVEEAKANGCRAEYMPLAFDVRARACGMMVKERDIPLLFCGTRGPNHAKREAWLTELGDLVTVAPPTFGRAYFKLLARAHAVLHVHAEWSRGIKNAMRLFEASGMGALVLTDGLDCDPVHPLPGIEIADVADLRGELRRDHWGTAEDATARTLECHTYESRIPRLIELARSL